MLSVEKTLKLPPPSLNTKHIAFSCLCRLCSIYFCNWFECVPKTSNLSGWHDILTAWPVSPSSCCYTAVLRPKGSRPFKSRAGSASCPPHLLDLTPSGYFTWRYLKYFVFRDLRTTIEKLNTKASSAFKLLTKIDWSTSTKAWKSLMFGIKRGRRSFWRSSPLKIVSFLHDWNAVLSIWNE